MQPKFLLIFLLTFSLFFTVNATAQNGTVVITITGIDIQKGGELAVAVFTEENFPKVGKQFKGLSVSVTATSMELIISEVPSGDYGIAVFQDVDRNKQLKKNFLGLPQEPMGFSNDAPTRFGPPSFEDARITVSNDQKTFVTLVLR